MAPELLKNLPYTIKVDVYSYGIILWELVTRALPYEGWNPTVIVYKVVTTNERPNLALVPPDCPPVVLLLVLL